MKAAVCEDEKTFAEHLAEIIGENLKEHSPEIKFFSDGHSLAQKTAAGEKFDLMFIDLNLENSDGMETAAIIRKYDKTVPIIFVTGIESRAAEGYSVSAFDYVYKSKVDEKLPQVLERFCREYFRAPLTFTDIDNITRVFSPSEIICVESEGRGTLWHTGSENIRSAMPVSKAAAMLSGDNFTQVYKGVFVNINEIKRIDSDTVELSNSEIYPLSRRRRKEVLSAVMKSMRKI